MSGSVFLDSSPLGLLTQKPGKSPEADACQQWLGELAVHGWTVYLPEIIDYEVRRELTRARKISSIVRLDQLITQVNYVPITTNAMRQAAELWAQARQNGIVTADPRALDGDVIMAAQALTLIPAPSNLVVATSNVAHISQYIRAQEWHTITP
jgi:predicted nucleic acid-binding protein